MPPATSEADHFSYDDTGRGQWLEAARKRAQLTQEDAARVSGVKLGVIVNAEAGRDLRTSRFLALVVAYGAEDALADWLAKHRTGREVKRAKPRATSRDAGREASGG